MHSYPLSIPDVICFTPKVFEDHRGFFYESFNEKVFEQSIKHPAPNFVQDNHSRSVRGVLRGLHYQIQKPQGKLVRVLEKDCEHAVGIYMARMQSAYVPKKVKLFTEFLVKHFAGSLDGARSGQSGKN